jgi:ATP-dependent phosphofructokinase / diphosphate-dependent phosphofructokinase
VFKQGPVPALVHGIIEYLAAIEAASAGTFGKMVALRGTEIELVPLEEALAEPKLLDPRLFETAEVFFG